MILLCAGWPAGWRIERYNTGLSNALAPCVGDEKHPYSIAEHRTDKVLRLKTEKAVAVGNAFNKGWFRDLFRKPP